MFNFFKRSKSQKSKQKHEGKLQSMHPNPNAADNACVNHSISILQSQSKDGAVIDTSGNRSECSKNKAESITQLNLTSSQHDITSDGDCNFHPSNNLKASNQKSSNLISNIMAKGRNKRKYVQNSNQSQHKNGSKSFKNNHKLKNQTSVELLNNSIEELEQMKNENNNAEEKTIENREENDDENIFHNNNNTDFETQKFINDSCDVNRVMILTENRIDDDHFHGAERGIDADEGGGCCSNDSHTATDTTIIVNDLVYGKYNSVSPIYMKPVNSVVNDVSSEHKPIKAEEPCENLIKMGQEPSKTNVTKQCNGKLPHTNYVNNAHREHQDHRESRDQRDDVSDDRDVFYEATESVPPAPEHERELEYKASLLLNINVNEQNNCNDISDNIIFNCDDHDRDDQNEMHDEVQVSENLVETLIDNQNNIEINDDDDANDHDENPNSSFNSSDSNEVNEGDNAFSNDSISLDNEPRTDFKYDADSDFQPLNGDADKLFKSEEFKKLNSMDDSVSLPDVVESRCILVLDEPANLDAIDKLNVDMKDLVNQESRYSVKLEEAEKQALEAQTKANELLIKIEELEREVSVKSWSVERLQAELESSHKEGECIRDRLKSQVTEMDALRLKSSTSEDELKLNYQNLEIEFSETQEKLKQVQQLANSLNVQLVTAKSETDAIMKEKDKLIEERAEEQKIVKEALELALKERAQMEAKWKHDFEQLRTFNSDREEHLMEDCEWKLRSMQKSCKDKMEAAEKERKATLEKVANLEKEAIRQQDEMKQIKSYEAEVSQLRGLTYDQKESLMSMTRQVDKLKSELEAVNTRLQEEIHNVQLIKRQCDFQLNEKERDALSRIEIARGEIAMQWEDRLLAEMNRLKVELEQIHLEERHSALNKIKADALEETEELTNKYNMREKQLCDEIGLLKESLVHRKDEMDTAQADADIKLMQSRMYVDRAEREHEQKLDRETSKRDKIIESLKEQYEKEKDDMEQHFSIRIQQVQDEFARELLDATEILKMKHKKELEEQWKQIVTDKEEALQIMDSRHKTRLDEADNKIRELISTSQHQLEELHQEHTIERTSLEQRDIKNAQEIETLHKKCRCLTNLFEEMRMRYERRDPRQEDLRQIEELKSIIEAQDRDLRVLTERLREIQLQQQHQQQYFQPPCPAPPRRNKNRNKNNQNCQSEQPQQQQVQLELSQPIPPQPIVSKPQPLKLNCDVIYEENETEMLDEQHNECVVIEETAIQPENVVVVEETNQVQNEQTVVIKDVNDEDAHVADMVEGIVDEIVQKIQQQDHIIVVPDVIADAVVE